MIKKLLVNVSVAALVAFAAASLPAQQVKPIVYGRSTIQFSSSFQGVLAQLGTGTTDLRGKDILTGFNSFVVKQGLIDLTSGVGEVQTYGGYVITVAGHVFGFQSLTFDTTNTAAPVVTALFSIDGRLQGRIPLFLIQLPDDFALPLQPQNGIQQLNGITLALAPQAANGINAVFGVQAIAGGINAGTADVYTVLAGPNNID